MNKRHKRIVPAFATEAEEADWWHENRNVHNKELPAAVRAGEAKILTKDELRRRIEASKEKPSPVVALRIPTADLALARKQAEQKGLPYQTYIKSLLHETLVERDATTENAVERKNLRLSYGNLCAPDQAPRFETQLWRFMDLARFVSMLNHKGLYFCVLAALDDKLEGALPRVPPEASDWDKKTAYIDWCSNRATVFVNCWHSAPDESAAMWKLYANQGVAIRTTFGLLSRAVHQRFATTPPNLDRMVRGGMVTYTDPDEPALPELRTPFQTALRKRCWYVYEQEFRLMYHLPSNALEPASGFQTGPSPERTGVWVSCNLTEAISRIVLAPFSPPFLEDDVKAITEKFGLSPSLVKRPRIEEGAPTSQEVFCLADLKPPSTLNQA